MADAAATDRVLRGTLEDGDARPLAGARVRVEGGGDEAISGPDGGFGVRVVPGRAAQVLRVTDRGREARLVVSTEAPEGVRVVVVAPDAVPFRVLTPANAPVPTRFGWQALRHVAGGLEAGALGDGPAPRFAARGLAPGTYALVLWAGPFLPTVVDPVTLDGTTSPGLVTVELMRRGASVAGRVLTPTGVARPGTRLSLRPEDPTLTLPAARTQAVADAGGRWRIEGLPAGRYTVLVDVGQGPPSEHALNLLEREERALDLVP
ncbi:MAG: carboxypeptidase-like regulatory domain-containing protein [Planctomycetota bacterium]